MIINLNKYKKSKIIVADLQSIIYTLENCQKELSKYKKYKPVNDVLNKIGSNKTLLKLYYKKYRSYIDVKGNTNGKMEKT